MNVVIQSKQLRKPRRILGIDWAHTASRGLVACVPFIDASGPPIELVRKRLPTGPAVMRMTAHGPAMPSAGGASDVFPSYGDVPAYDTPNDMTAVCLLDVRSWSTTTSGDFMWGKNTFQTRGWMLLNNGTFANQVGFRTDRAGTSDYAAVSRATVGTGLMLMVGRRTGLTIEFLTVTASNGLVQLVSVLEGLTGMVSPAGAQLEIGTTNANGDIDVLGCWLWSHALPNSHLLELFNSPWAMLQEDRLRTRVVVYRQVTKTTTITVSATQGVASTKSPLVHAQQLFGVTKTLPVSATGFVAHTATISVSAGLLVSKIITLLIEARQGVGLSKYILVEARGAVFFSDWPSSLPVYPLVDGWKLVLPKTGSRTGIDKFPLVQRQRSRAGVTPFNSVLELTSAQVTTLFDFYEDTLGHGAISFQVADPLTEDIVKMRFRGNELPTAVPIGYDTYHVSLPLEIMP